LGERIVEVIRPLNLVIEEGEFVAIMGPSGSGKSTVLNLLGLLDLPTSGKVLSNKKEISHLTDSELAAFRNRMIGFVFQTFRLLPQYNALDNVVLPLVYVGEMNRRPEGKQLLQRMGLGDRIHHKPSELSGGECQRVAICRAIINRPKILLADEPTGALDTNTGEGIMNIFSDLHQSGITIVMVTHDVHLAKKAQRIIHFVNGVLQ
jgi:putative ABC transport system ATP-binding protein